MARGTCSWCYASASRLRTGHGDSPRTSAIVSSSSFQVPTALFFLSPTSHTAMYSSRDAYGTTPPELSNNPFIDHPANAMTRYPDITGSDNPANSQYTSWMNGPSASSLGSNLSSPYGNPNSMSPQGYGTAPGYQSQPQTTGWSQGSGFSQPQQSYGQYPSAQMQPQQSPSGMPFQPTSSFGQQLHAHVNSAYGTPQPQQQQQPQYSGYSAAQSPGYGQGYQQGYPGQQQQYFSEFDPYPQGAQPTQQQQQQGSMPTPGALPSSSGSRGQHPREYVQHHKAELETWDSYAWKQVSSPGSSHNRTVSEHAFIGANIGAELFRRPKTSMGDPPSRARGPSKGSRRCRPVQWRRRRLWGDVRWQCRGTAVLASRKRASVFF